MTIDSHQHFWKYDPEEHAWITNEMFPIRRDFMPSDLAPLLKRHGIDGCVAVQVAQSETENEFLVSLAEQHSFIKGVVGWVDLRSDRIDERLEHYRRFPVIKGFRHIVQSEPAGFLGDSRFVKGVSRLASYDFTYDLLIYHHQLQEALVFVNALADEVRLIVDHLAKPAIKAAEITTWATHMKALAAFDNVYCKMSGMLTEADWKAWQYDELVPYFDRIFEFFGPSRIVYGSDWPVSLLAADYDRQYGVVTRYLEQLSPAERRGVLGENAERFYNL